MPKVPVWVRNMLDTYIKREAFSKKQWDNDVAGICICQFVLPESAEKNCLFLPENSSKSALELLFCLDGTMTVCGLDTLPLNVEKGRILILSKTCGSVSLHVHTRFRGILASLDFMRVQDTVCSACGMELNLTELLGKLETQCGLLLLSDHDWDNGMFDLLEYLPELVYGQCCFLRILEFLLAFGARKEIVEIPEASPNPTYSSCRVLAVQAYMKEHLSEKITIADLSRIASLSPTYLKAEFHRACGKPIHRWLVELRIQRAAARIRCTELPIYQIAQEVGYESMSQFTSVFRKQYGVTPGKYKKMSKTETECLIP